MAWQILRYSKSAVRRAGELIGRGDGDPDEIRDAREKLSNYRSSHAYPLLAITMHVRSRVKPISPNAIVARRLKRLPTIIDKLERHPNMNVTTMQDLGGTRVVLATVDEVDRVVASLRSANAQNKIVREYDYLRADPGPQASGYRGVHLVYEYRASKQAYVGNKIEVQVRTELQHAWATAVETLDLFDGTRLKYGEGDAAHTRYFLVVSALMALEEGLPLPPGIDATGQGLVDELRGLEERLGITRKLTSYAAVVRGFADRSNRRGTLILELRRREHELHISLYENLAGAETALAEIEALDDPNIDAVLVSISKVGQLQSAYPNYFAHTGKFTAFVGRKMGPARSRTTFR